MTASTAGLRSNGPSPCPRSKRSSRPWTTAPRPKPPTMCADWLEAPRGGLRPFHRRRLHGAAEGQTLRGARPRHGERAGQGGAGLGGRRRRGGGGRARAPSRAGRRLPGHVRARHLYALARHIQKRERFLSVLETLDNGKPIRESPRHRHSAGRPPLLPSRRLGRADRDASSPATGRSASAARSSRGTSRC